MQASTVSPVTNTTVPSNITTTTKSKEQVLMQSSGAMIAVIVIGIIIILTIVLIILKTYNSQPEGLDPHTMNLRAPKIINKKQEKIKKCILKLNKTIQEGKIPLGELLTTKRHVEFDMGHGMMRRHMRTHVSRVLGPSGASKPRAKMSQSTTQSNMPLSTIGVSSVSGSIANSIPGSDNSFRLPRVEENHIEQFSTTSGSTVVTVNDLPSLGNT